MIMPDYTKKKLKWDKNCNKYSFSPWMQLLKASIEVHKLCLYFAVKACMFNVQFRWIPSWSFPQPKNQIIKPAKSNGIILVAAVFHFVATVEELKKLKI